MSTWLEGTYMARKGVAKGKPGKTHQLTVEKQGKYHYVYGPYADPVLHIKPGDIVVAETQDAFEGEIKNESDKPSELLNVPFLNPQCGPIAVEGAEKGDVLCVYIHSIKPRGPQPVGTTALITEFGGLVATNNTALLNPPLPERVKKMEVTEQGIKFNKQDHAALRAVHRHARRLARDRGGDLAAAGLLGRQHGPARRLPGRRRLFPGPPQGRLSLSRRLPRHAGRRRALRRRRRDPVDDHGPGRPDQALADRLAAPREREASS